MKNLKNIIAIAVVAAITSPMEAMANTAPDNVGNVTYMGKIVANSPMWQWTVNDYPGPRLDAKPSEATTENGVTVYKLAGQPFIAVSGYLPSMTGMLGPAVTTLGTRDITEFRDGNGNPIADIQPLNEPQAVSFTISAISTDKNGAQAVGSLKLKATEIRGVRRVYTEVKNQTTGRILSVFTSAQNQFTTSNSSCFIGTSGPKLTLGGTVENPTITGGSSSAIAAFIQTLLSADNAGSVRLANTPTVNNNNDRVIALEKSCRIPSNDSANLYDENFDVRVPYIAAGHIVELTPTELAFSTPVQGAWNATLNVTAYQM